MNGTDARKRFRGLFMGQPQSLALTTVQDFKDELEKQTAQANLESFGQVVSLNSERILWAKRMHRHLEHSFEAVKIMCLIAYILGWALVLIPFIMFYASSSRDPNLLWFSGIGLAETVSILVYQPMQRVQKATSDMVQSTIILSSWATEVGLTLYLMKLKTLEKTEDIAKATHNICVISEQYVKLLEKFAEDGSKGSSKEKTGSSTPH